MSRLLVMLALGCVLLLPSRAEAAAPRPNALEVGAAVATCMADARGTEVAIDGLVNASTVVTLSEDGQVFGLLRRRAADPSRDPSFVLDDPITPVMALEPLPIGRDWDDTPEHREQARYAFQCFGTEYRRLLAADS